MEPIEEDLMPNWHEVVVDGLTYRFRDPETADRFRKGERGDRDQRPPWDEVAYVAEVVDHDHGEP